MDSDLNNSVIETSAPPTTPVSPPSAEKIIDAVESAVEKIKDIVQDLETSPEVAKLAEVVAGVASSGSWSCSFFDWISSLKTRLYSPAKPAAPSSTESN
jgi:hypothetical protein